MAEIYAKIEGPSDQDTYRILVEALLEAQQEFWTCHGRRPNADELQVDIQEIDGQYVAEVVGERDADAAHLSVGRDAILRVLLAYDLQLSPGTEVFYRGRSLPVEAA